MQTKLIAGLTAAAFTAITLGSAAVGASSDVDRTSRSEGPTVVHDPAFAGTAAAVEAVTTGSGTTVVTLHLSGLPDAVRGRSLGAHVHTKPCGQDPLASGGHYLHPAPAGTPLHDREVWLDVDVNPAGNARSTAVADFTVAPGARSVVVHALATNHDTGAAGARLFCTDVAFGAQR